MQMKIKYYFISFCQIDTETCKCLMIFRASEKVKKHTVLTTIRANYLEEILAIYTKIKDADSN